MSTKHQFCDHCDTLPLQEPPYHEDLLLAQMERDWHDEFAMWVRDTKLTIAAIKANGKCINDGGTGNEYRLANILSMALANAKATYSELFPPVEAGGDFPPCYFDGMPEALDGLTIRTEGRVVA